MEMETGTDSKSPAAGCRRRWLLGLPFPLVEGFLGLVLALWGANLWIKAKRNAEWKQVEAALMSIVLPEVRFEETPFPEAIRQLNAMLHHADPVLGEKLIEFYGLVHEPSGPDWIEAIEYGLGPTDSRDLSECKITLTLPEVSVAEALRYTSALANLRYTIIGRRVLITHFHADLSDLRNPIEIPFDWISWKFYEFRDARWPRWQRRFRAWLPGSSTAPPDPFR